MPPLLFFFGTQGTPKSLDIFRPGMHLTGISLSGIGTVVKASFLVRVTTINGRTFDKREELFSLV